MKVMIFLKTLSALGVCGLLGCVVETVEPVPVAAGLGTQINTSTAAQVISVDITRVPVLASCAVGQIVQRTATGWTCIAPSASTGTVAALTALRCQEGQVIKWQGGAPTCADESGVSAAQLSAARMDLTAQLDVLRQENLQLRVRLAASETPGFAAVMPGAFTMGSNMPGEGPPRVVNITRPYLIKRTEVTQTEWMAIMGDNPSTFANCGANCPVENVSWDRAVQYLNALSAREGLPACYQGAPGVFSFTGLDCTGYRLPTEAEWECAARSGSTEDLVNGMLSVQDCGVDASLDQLGWYCGNATAAYMGCIGGIGPLGCIGPQPVGGKAGNGFGLVDVHGNVAEWVNDWHSDNYYASRPDPDTDPEGPATGTEKVARGGAFELTSQQARLPFRGVRATTNTGQRFIGFRPVRTVP